MNPAAWVEFPFGIAPAAGHKESKAAEIQRVLLENQGPETCFSLVEIFVGTIPAAIVNGNSVYPGVMDGQTELSKDFPGFALGFNFDLSANTDLSGDILFSGNFSDSPFRMEKVPVRTITQQTTGEKYLKLDFPTGAQSLLFWRFENPTLNPVQISFHVPFVEVRR